MDNLGFISLFAVNRPHTGIQNKKNTFDIPGALAPSSCPRLQTAESVTQEWTHVESGSCNISSLLRFTSMFHDRDLHCREASVAQRKPNVTEFPISRYLRNDAA